MQKHPRGADILAIQNYSFLAQTSLRQQRSQAGLRAVQTARRMLTSHVTFTAVLETILLEVAEEYRQWPW